MEQRVEEVTRRPLYVYDLPSDILTTLRRRDELTSEPDRSQDVTISDDRSELKIGKEPAAAVGSTACSLCGLTFHTSEDQRSHIRSDFHNYNLKQKLRGIPAVSESEFETLIGDLDESLSGSDSSESGDDEDGDDKVSLLSALLKNQAKIASPSDDPSAMIFEKRRRGYGKSPLFWFTTPVLPSNIHLGIYRALFTDAEQKDEPTVVHTIKSKQLSPRPVFKQPKDNSTAVPPTSENLGPHIFMGMIGGGHFAAMVVSLSPKQNKASAPGPLSREANVVAHKTFHRYTTRRKQGGSQSANDSAKGNAHSAGAGIRRYNEAALSDEVRLLLSEWKEMIDTSDMIFIRATGSNNRRTLFGPYEGQVLRQNDPRIRGFPFSTRRATQNELMRSFIELTRVKVQEADQEAAAIAQVSERRPLATTSHGPGPTPTAQKLSDEDETALLHTSQIQTLIRRSKLPALLSYFKSNNITADFLFYPQDSPQNRHVSTPLHLAASLNSPPLVSGLLIKAGASPMILNGDNKPPFDLTSDRSTRDAFRVARSVLGESSFDWEVAHVPAPLSADEAAERESRHRQEEKIREDSRRKLEAERLKHEGPKVPDLTPLGKAAERGRMLALGHVQKTAQERREEESKGLTPEMRMRLDRERRARAAEERMKKVASSAR